MPLIAVNPVLSALDADGVLLGVLDTGTAPVGVLTTAGDPAVDAVLDAIRDSASCADDRAAGDRGSASTVRVAHPASVIASTVSTAELRRAELATDGFAALRTISTSSSAGDHGEGRLGHLADVGAAPERCTEERRLVSARFPRPVAPRRGRFTVGDQSRSGTAQSASRYGDRRSLCPEALELLIANAVRPDCRSHRLAECITHDAQPIENFSCQLYLARRPVEIS